METTDRRRTIAGLTDSMNKVARLVQNEETGFNAGKLGDIQEHNDEADAFAKSQRFNESVQNIEQVRRNLANLDMNNVAEGPVKGNEAPNVINGLNL